MKVFPSASPSPLLSQFWLQIGPVKRDIIEKKIKLMLNMTYKFAVAK